MNQHRRQADRFSTAKLVVALIGGLFLAGGGALFIFELRGERRPTVLSIAFGAGVFGAGMLSPDAVFDRLKRMAGVARGVVKRDSGTFSLPKAPRDPNDGRGMG